MRESADCVSTVYPSNNSDTAVSRLCVRSAPLSQIRCASQLTVCPHRTPHKSVQESVDCSFTAYPSNISDAGKADCLSTAYPSHLECGSQLTVCPQRTPHNSDAGVS